MLLLYGFGLKTVNYFTTHWPASQPAHGRKVRQARPTPDSAVGHKLYKFQISSLSGDGSRNRPLFIYTSILYTLQYTPLPQQVELN